MGRHLTQARTMGAPVIACVHLENDWDTDTEHWFQVVQDGTLINQSDSQQEMCMLKLLLMDSLVANQ